ncbi:MAG: hypothetical protein KF860_11425 [Cyclobacteriaceae bacterium]|nr:hypothetical protein [Cyclobacteriaceae bacterium]
MELRDLIVTPIIIFLVYAGAYWIRPRVTDSINRKYFIPGLTVRIIGALSLGFLYQFYYGGGDTFMYHTHGSRFVWEAFCDSPLLGLKLLFSDGSNQAGIYKYASQIYFFRDPASYTVIRVASLFDLITFSTYSATALLFAALSFIGMWMFFLTFYKQYPQLHRSLAVASFFIPSVFFWGSGILKDSITLACLGIATYYFYKIFLEKKISFINFLSLLIALFGIFSVKKFILQAYLPAVIVWVFAYNFISVRSKILKILFIPFTVILIIGSSYYAILKVGEDDARYSVSKIAETAKVTAYDIRYWSGRDAGSGYALGQLDGTIGSMVRLAPQAINVSLFRPYLWEVRNPLMLLSAIESFCLFAFVLYVIVKKRLLFFSAFTNPNVLFAMAFSISFAFAVGVSTFNFGSLARYKIPLLPFFLVALILILNYSKRDRKPFELESTE